MTLLDTIPVYTPSLVAVIITAVLGLIGLLFTWHKKPRVSKIGAIAACALMIINAILLVAGVYNVHTADRYVVILNDDIPASFFNNYTLVKSYEYSDAILIERKDK